MLCDYVSTLIIKHDEIINRLLLMLNLPKQQLDEWWICFLFLFLEYYRDHQIAHSIIGSYHPIYIIGIIDQALD